MRPEEAERIGEEVRKLGLGPGSIVLDLGSSTGEFRTKTKPHIDREIFAPLENAGVSVVHADMKDAEGVDIVGNVTEPKCQKMLRDLNPSLVLCCNILEHVADREVFVDAVSSIVPARAHLVATVPHSYFYHEDPIDTMFRPTPAELASLFGRKFEIVASDLITSKTWLSDLRNDRGAAGGLAYLVRDAAKVPYCMMTGRVWRWRVNRYWWLWHPFRISFVVLRKH